MADWIPKRDTDFSGWLANFLTVIAPYVAALGLTAPDITAIDGQKLTFDITIADQVVKQTAAEGATEEKRAARDDLEGLLRPLVRRIQASPNMTNGLRSQLGLPVRSDVRITSEMGDEIPDIYLEAMPGKILVHFGTAPSNEQINTKPSWAKGCNIYRKKTGEAGFSRLDFETASPYIDEIIGPAADYSYIVRYRGKRAADLGTPSSPSTIAASGLLAA